MPVPTALTDLSTTIADNSPAGGDVVGSTLDDYLRAHAGLIAQANAAALQKTSNLSDLTSAADARTNLGLGTAATQGTTTFLQAANNLSEVNAANARTNLGLGSAAQASTASFAQLANNLSDIPDKAAARANLGVDAGGTYALLANNLSDLPDKAIARSNLGVGAAGAYPLLSNNLSDIPDKAAARANLGVGAGGAYPLLSNNLSDMPDKAVSRTNLGLGTAAVQNVTAFAQVANNLSDVTASSARTNLGLGTAAVQNVGTFVQVANNLSDVTASTARTNLGLAIGSNVQAYSSELAGVAGLAATGVLSRTGSGTYVPRTMTGTSGRISVSNGDGVAGAPSIDLATVADAATGSFLKIQRDSYGRVSGTTAVVAADITGLIGSIGTMAAQAASSVAVTGGTINGTAIGGTTAALGRFIQAREVSASPSWSGNTAPCDWSTGGAFYFTTGATASCTLSFSNLPASGIAASVVVTIVGTGGTRTWTWPTNTRWEGGVAPTLPATGRSVIVFFTDDGGSNVIGSVVVTNAS